MGDYICPASSHQAPGFFVHSGAAEPQWWLVAAPLLHVAR